MKITTAQELEKDSVLTAHAVDDIEQVITTLHEQRRQTGDGPSEAETNKKKWVVKMNQSINRGTSMLHCIQKDMDMLALVCKGQLIPDDHYDSYNVKHSDLEVMKK